MSCWHWVQRQRSRELVMQRPRFYATLAAFYLRLRRRVLRLRSVYIAASALRTRLSLVYLESTLLCVL